MSESCPNCCPCSFNFDAHSSPFHAQLGKCIAFDTPTPERHGILEYVRNIEPAVASCRDRVSRLTAVLADAQSQLDSLEELRRAHIKLFPPIHMLPAEVLLKIFELAVEKPYNFSLIKNSPWCLGHVCRLWRQITSVPSSLWSSAYCRPSYYHGYSGEMLATVFERSLPLVFDYDMEGESTIDILKRHSLRWQDVTLSSHPDLFIQQLGEVGPLPLLTTVVLNFTDWAGFRPKKCTLAQILHVFQSAPTLQSLNLKSSSSLEGLTPLPPAFPWHQLTHLEHSLLSSTFLLDCQLLLHCPHLQSYITHTRKEPGSSDAVAHSKLKLLDIKHVALLRYLQCASLTELKIDTGSIDYADDEEVEGYTSSFRTFLANWPMLTSISVQASSSRRACPFIPTFTSPTIQSLKLDITGNHEDLVPLVASATPLLVPHMTYLECTSSRFLANSALLVQTLFAVIQSRWRVERREVAKLQSVRLFFGRNYRAGGDDDSDELGRMIDSLRVFKEEGLDVVVFQGVDKAKQRLL